MKSNRAVKVSISKNSENEFLVILDEKGLTEHSFLGYINDGGMDVAMYDVIVDEDEKGEVNPSQLEILERNADRVYE